MVSIGIQEIKKLNKMKNDTSEHIQNVKQTMQENFQVLDYNLGQIQDEYHRVAELSGQAGYIINKIDKDFKEKTKLDDKDIILLFLAVALQCARQYIFSNDKFRITATEGDKLIEKALTPFPPNWQDILTQSVPYDAIATSNLFKYSTGISGTTHRYRTLGHDPLLGWIFGTANIITSSLTKYNFESFYVDNMVISRHYPLGTMGMLEKSYSRIQQDPMILLAAVSRQAMHYGSDYFTKQGLPIPIISSVNNDLSAKMVKDWHIDLRSVNRGAALSVIINQIIICIHRLLYDESKDGTKTMYEVRTRKILSYSNVMASGSNVIYVAISRDLAKLDIGGLLVTLYRLVSDYEFINNVKKEFLREEIHNMIVGSEYDFMKKGDS